VAFLDALFGPRRADRHDRQSSMTLEDLLRDFTEKTYSGVTVSADSAMRLSAVWACVRLISDVVSTMPLAAFDRETRQQIDVPFLDQPSADLPDLSDWLWAALSSALTNGYAVGLIVDRSGASLRPSQIELLAPHRVTATVMADRSVVWRLDGREIDRRNLWTFVPFPCPERPLGLSPIGYAKQTVGLGLASERFGAAFFENAGIPVGIVRVKGGLDNPYADQLKRVFSGKRRSIAVLEGDDADGTTWESVSIPPNESQFLDSQRFTVTQIARIYGVPPEVIGSESGNSQTYANVSERTLGLLKFCIGPWLTKLERKLTKLCPPGGYVKFNANALVRADLKTRFEAYRIALGKDVPFMEVDQVRELEDWQPMGQEAPPRLRAVR
jgi:HK97 family phage portal protein